jgi:bacterioferritin-associated ferredoxin
MSRGRVVVCRCEDVALEEIENLIDGGVTDLEEIKRFLHVGMGPCQGKSCGRLIAKILKDKTGRPSVHESFKARPPGVALRMGRILGDEDAIDG